MRKPLTDLFWLKMAIFTAISAIAIFSLTGALTFPKSQTSLSAHAISPCQTAEACYDHALRLSEHTGKDQAPHELQISAFRTIQEKFPGSIWGRRAGIRIGLLLTQKDPATAIQFFNIALRDFPILDDYLQFWIAESWHRIRKTRQAAIMFEAILAKDPKSILKREAALRAGEAWLEAGECEESTPFLRQAFSMDPEFPSAAGILLKIADCAIQDNQLTEAQEVLREIWWRYPNQPEAKNAMEHLKKIEPHIDSVISPQDRYHRAKSFFKLALFQEAIIELQTFLQNAPEDPQLEEAKFKLGMAWVRLKKYDQAQQIFRELAGSGNPQSKKATVWLARSYLRQNRGSDLLGLTKSKLLSHLSADQKSTVYRIAGFWLEDHGKREQATQLYQQAARLAASAKTRLDALWRMGWIHYQSKDFKKAARTFQKMLAAYSDRKKLDYAQYWLARSLEQLGQKDNAQNLYSELSQALPMTYYGQLALSRLANPNHDPKLRLIDKQEHSPILPIMQNGNASPLRKDTHFKKAKELFVLGLHQESAQEWGTLADHSDLNPEDALLLARMLVRVHDETRASRLATRLLGKRVQSDDSLTAQALWSVAYPTGYLSTIQAYVKDPLDPYLVVALIREESRYYPQAISRVGALGLMQLMPTTANRMSKKLGLPHVGRELLLTEQINIQLGTTFLAELIQQYQGNIVYAVAAYNAGPTAVNRWIASFGKKASDEFVELISYRETRGYVKRVLESYRIYRDLHSDGCPAVSLDTAC